MHNKNTSLPTSFTQKVVYYTCLFCIINFPLYCSDFPYHFFFFVFLFLWDWGLNLAPLLQSKCSTIWGTPLVQFALWLFWIGISQTAEAGLEPWTSNLLISLISPSNCWDYRHEPLALSLLLAPSFAVLPKLFSSSWAQAVDLLPFPSSWDHRWPGPPPGPFSFFTVLGFELVVTPWAHSISPFLWSVFQTVNPSWLRTTILPISASWAARIIGVSHWHPALFFFFQSKLYRPIIENLNNY
jgi:hypothetical protein